MRCCFASSDFEAANLSGNLTKCWTLTLTSILAGGGGGGGEGVYVAVISLLLHATETGAGVDSIVGYKQLGSRMCHH